MRDIEGHYFEDVNERPKRRDTTHIRVYKGTKDGLLHRARQEKMTLANYLEKLLADSFMWEVHNL